MSNKMFLLHVSNLESFTLVASENDESKLLHLRYGQFNIKGLKFLVDKRMVLGQPKKLIMFKSGKGAFMENKLGSLFRLEKLGWLQYFLELIHVDLCGPMHYIFYWVLLFSPIL